MMRANGVARSVKLNLYFYSKKLSQQQLLAQLLVLIYSARSAYHALISGDQA